MTTLLSDCQKCGLPMSYSDQPVDDPPQWLCDGPNDNTDKKGCGHALGPCDDYAPDSLNPEMSDRDVCTTCFFRGADHS